MFRVSGLDRFIERVGQKKIAGFRFDGHEPSHVPRLQFRLQASGVELLGTIDDRFGLG